MPLGILTAVLGGPALLGAGFAVRDGAKNVWATGAEHEILDQPESHPPPRPVGEVAEFSRPVGSSWVTSIAAAHVLNAGPPPSLAKPRDTSPRWERGRVQFPTMRTSRHRAILILFLLVAPLLASCDKAPSPPANSTSSMRRRRQPSLRPEPIRGVVTPDPATRMGRLHPPRRAGRRGIPHPLGEAVHAGDVVAEIDSPEVGRWVYELRRMEVDYLAARGEIADAEARVEALKADVDAKVVEAEIAEDQVAEFRLKYVPETTRDLTDIRLAAIRLRAEVGDLRAAADVARRDVTQARDRSDALVRAASALRSLIGPHIDPPGSQGRWAEGDRPSIVRLTAPADGRIVAIPVRVGEGLPAGTGVIRIADLSSVAIVPTAEDEYRLLDLEGRPVRVLDGTGKEIATGSITIEWLAGVEGEGARRVRIVVANAEGSLKLGQRVVIEPAGVK